VHYLFEDKLFEFIITPPEKRFFGLSIPKRRWTIDSFALQSGSRPTVEFHSSIPLPYKCRAAGKALVILHRENLRLFYEEIEMQGLLLGFSLINI
jgi:hypothetical protein